VLCQVLFNKHWNADLHEPLFRMHRVIGHSLSFELSHEDRKHLDEYWQSQLAKEQHPMYWNLLEAKRPNVRKLKMLPKRMIARLFVYFALLTAGLLFVVIPSTYRHQSLRSFGLSSSTLNLVFLFFAVTTLVTEICQLFARSTILKREASNLRCLGFDRVPLKFLLANHHVKSQQC